MYSNNELIQKMVIVHNNGFRMYLHLQNVQSTEKNDRLCTNNKRNRGKKSRDYQCTYIESVTGTRIEENGSSDQAKGPQG